MSTEKRLQQAIEATQKDDLERARELLLELLREDNREPLYWLLMSTAVESRDERIYCLHNVLSLDPDNSAAKHDLTLIGAPLPEIDAPVEEPAPALDWQTKEIAAPKIPTRVRKRGEEPWPISWILGSLGLGLVLILLGYYAAANGLLDQFIQANSTPSQNAFFIPSPKASTFPQATAEVTATRVIEVVPRDPSELLEATYTPTPMYVNTPHPNATAFEEGLQAMRAQDFEAAIAAFEQHLSSNPRDADAAYYIGEAYYRLKDYQAALDAYNQALALNSQLAPAYLGRALAGEELGLESSGLITDLNTALLLEPEFGLGYIGRAVYYLNRANPQEALNDLVEAESLLPNSALLYSTKAQAYLLTEDYEQALVASQRAYELDITVLSNYLVLAQAQQATGNATASVEILQSYLSFEGDDGEAWEWLGLAYYLAGNGAAALEAFERALDIDPNLPTASYYKGLDEEVNGNNNSALGYFRAAVTGRPDWFEARIALARGYMNGGNPGNGFLEINSAANLIESIEQRAAFHYWRATILDTLGQAATALADWRSLLALPADAMPPEWRQAAQERVLNP